MSNPNIWKHGFKKGHSGNPAGMKPLSKDTLKLKNITKEECTKLISSSFLKTVPILKDVIKSTTASSHEVFIASLILNGINRGDANAYEKLMDRCVGKPAQALEHSGKIDSKISLTEFQKSLSSCIEVNEKENGNE